MNILGFTRWVLLASSWMGALRLPATKAIARRQASMRGDPQGNRYTNPVLPGDFSDLDAVRVGEDSYAISSTLQYSPGMVVLHSRDLVH